MAKLVDVLALGASEVTHGGSSPLPGTKANKRSLSSVPGVKHDMLYERGRENLEYIARSEASTIRKVYRPCKGQDSSP